MIDDEDDDLENFSIEMNLSEVIPKLPEYSMENLCDIIICDRYLGFNHDLAVACMEELGRRRSLGDTFDFEEYIEREFKALPKINSSMPDLQTVLSQTIIGMKL